MDKMCSVSKTITQGKKKIQVCDATRSQLIPILRQIQEKKGYISDKNMQEVASSLGIHPVEVYSVVTFYSFLTTEKKGKHIIRISNCISSVMAGSKRIIKIFEKELGIKVGETTKDKKLSLEETSCIGMCDQAPAALIDGNLIGKLTAKKVKNIVKELKK
ncbi:MAG: NAD(P)H-dependent oxidoreductase subunit E [Candidatus Omnitrophica bacterium]|nr:NAD(P)H-dependent oxidoreductase subunit E [Candidatus Omnitrophota bacterium]MCF7893542.1 NAD(P)H-dependent oxidoreductase subunit E [Candidatus Omnitrophota bacterium]